MDNNNNAATGTTGDMIDLRALFMEIWSHALIIVAAGVLCAFVAFIYSEVSVTPMYRSSTKVYVIQRGSSNVTTGELALSQQLVNDYAEIIKSNSVCSIAAKNLGLNMTAGQLASIISVSSSGKSQRVLSISAVHSNPETARRIADEVRAVATDYIFQVMELPEITLIDEATLPTTPYNTTDTKKSAMMGFLGGFAAAAAVFAVKYFLDDTIKNEDDVSNCLGLSVLGTVPLRENSQEANERKSILKSKMSTFKKRVSNSVTRRSRSQR